MTNRNLPQNRIFKKDHSSIWARVIPAICLSRNSSLLSSSLPSSHRRMFPQLPEIRDNSLRQKVFTHKSFLGLPAGRETDPDPQDNERLALLGASVLEAAVTNILYKKYPHHRKAYIATTRSDLVAEKQLSRWAQSYGLPDSLRCQYSTEMLVRTQPKVQASLFAAYVGALFIENALPGVEPWLEQLIEFEHEEDATETNLVGGASRGIGEGHAGDQHRVPAPSFSSQPPPAAPPPSQDPPDQPLSHSQGAEGAQSQSRSSQDLGSPPGSVTSISIFNQRALERDVRVEWDETQQGTQWNVAVNVDGNAVGAGVHQDRRAARNIAAQEALGRLGW